MLLAFFEWCEKSPLALAILDRGWMPISNVVHELGMTLLLGAVFVGNLRMLGLVMRERPLEELWGELRPWIQVGIITMLLSGLVMFLPESLRWYRSGPFRIKMAFFLAALAFQYAVYRRVRRVGPPSNGVCRLVGILALTLWFAVGWGGRAITFLGEF